MTRHPRRIVGLAAALLLTAAGAQAQGHSQDKDHGNGKDKDKQEQRAEGRDQRVDGRDARDRSVQVPTQNGRGVYRQGVDQRQVYNQDRRIPPGLAKKPGGMPPGQYRKYAPSEGAGALRDVFQRHGYTVVRTDNAGASQYVYYRLRNGGVRRAIVSPGTNQLSFSNVPTSLLQEVLARLY